ncbi:MAG: ATP-binding protein [Deltaproteobacteria bacterium]|jgi:two-component system NtrC family sensor kinase
MSQDPHDRAKTSAAAHGARPTRERADRTGRRSLEPAELASLRETPLVRDTRPGGLGLRAQIGMALSTTLALSVVLIALATDRLSTRALEIERHHAAELAARSAAVSLVRVTAPAMLVDRVEQAIVGHDAVTGLEIVASDGAIETRGVVGEGIGAEAELQGGRVRVWVAHPGEEAARNLVGLIVLYALLSAIAILVLSYVLLTRLIVRPVEQLERAAQRLARGERSPARIEGAREVASLAMTFNALGDDLREERAARERRLRELEEALGALEAAKTSLEQAQASLVRSEKLASVGRLAAGVAHEIGNPLSAILGFVELLRGGGLEPADTDEFLRRVQSETERIHRIIRNLLDFARKPAEGDAAGAAEVAEAVADAVHLVSPQKDLRGIRIERRIAEELPPVALDADRLTQVLLNLLLNAADAIESRRERDMQAARAAERATDDTILVEAALDGGQVVLRVLDSGTGIEPAALGSLFEPFFTTKPVGRGTGLGLAVCQTIVEEAHGSIRAETHASGGACFEIRLPVRAGRRA